MRTFKNLFADLTPSKILKAAACVFSSLSLTSYVNLFVLNLPELRLILFVCFLGICGILTCAADRFFKSVSQPKTVLLAVAAACFILAGFRHVFFPAAQEVFISLVSETSGEICLCDIVVDGENIPIFQVEIVENSGWLYREQYDNFMIYPEEDGIENRLTMRFFAEEVHVGFPYTPYAGSVMITSSAGGEGSGIYDLRCPELKEGEAVKFADFPIDCRRIFTPPELLWYSIGLLPFLSFLCLILFYAVGLARRKYLPQFNWPQLNWPQLNRPQSSEHRRSPGLPPAPDISTLSRFGQRLCFPAALLAVHYLLFSTSQKINPDKPTAVFLVLLTAASYLCLFSGLGRRVLEKYRTRGKIALTTLIALYASFASFGQRFFLDGNTRMHFSAEGLFYVALGTVWFIPVIFTLLFVLELLASASVPRKGAAHRRRAFWGLFAILCLCQAVVLWSFWPGGFPSDCIVQLIQAVGIRRINNWHPVLNTLLYRVVLTICPHVGALVAVQLFFFSLLCTAFLMLGYDRGISFKVLAILGAVSGLLPNQVIFGISPLKDYPYTLSLLWMTYLLVRLALNPRELWRWQFLLSLPLSLFLIYGFRHNGVIPFAALLLLFAWITLRHFPQVKLRLAVVSLAGILLAALYKGPVFSCLQVSQTPAMSPYTTMLCAAASCVNKGLPLSEESTAIMESVLPLEQWADYYDRYRGSDLYYYGRGDLASKYPFNPLLITGREAFTVYLEALGKYPDVVIKDRLDGTDLLWDVRQPPDSFNARIFDTTIISEEDGDIKKYFDQMEYGVVYSNPSRLADLYRSTTNIPVNNVFDMLLWRSGAYLILLLTLFLFWLGNRMRTLLWALVPLLGQITGMMLVLCHQSYRFVSAVQSLTLALIFCSIILHDTQDGRTFPKLC